MEPFYVGKGKWDRCYRKYRNLYFNNIVNKVNKVDCTVNILEDNLIEEEAFQCEYWYIHEYIVVENIQKNLVKKLVKG
jgi:hypothetical protein